jgi:choline dehydrogenase-like flavoprotein
MIIDGETVGRDMNVTTRVCVIGSGAGGAVVADELAEAGVDVVLLEEGGFFTGKDFTGDAREMIALLYRNQGLTGTVGALTIPIPLGKCVGGTTVINSGTCYRAPDYVLEAWRRDFGVESIEEPAMRPYFEQVESKLNVQPVPDATYGNNSRFFERGAQALGFAGARIPRNARGCLGTGVCALGCPQDAKQAMHVSYVPRALAAGASLYTRCRAERVLTSNGRAFGVVASLLDRSDRQTGRQVRVLADRIIVACGALLTPALLQRSGVADRSGRLGRNLHIHPATRVGALFDETVRGWEEVPQAFNVHQFTPDGIFIQGQFVPPALEAPALPGIGYQHKSLMAQFARLGSFGALIAGGAREVYPGIRRKPVLRDATEARELLNESLHARDIEMMAFHPQGTCRMGTDPRQAVTNSVGEVHGVRHLYVADASLFPSSSKVNPQVTIMALATRIAAHIASDL